MRRLLALLSLILLMSCAHAQNKLEPIRLCVSTVQNSSRSLVDMTWQRDQLIKAFERINKGKDVTKGKAARIEIVQLESYSETDPAVRENECQFILHTNLTEIIHAGTSDMTTRPRSVQVGNAGDPRANAPDSNSATVEYRIMQAGVLDARASGVVTTHDQLPDEMLVSHLMDQIANRVAGELRERH